MKSRVITAVVLLVLTFSLCLAGLWDGGRQYRKLSELLQQAETAAFQEDLAELDRLTWEIRDRWDTWEPLGATFLHHNELEAIAKELSEMEISLKMQNPDEYRMACHVALHLMEHIYYTELPTLSNIL